MTAAPASSSRPSARDRVLRAAPAAVGLMAALLLGLLGTQQWQNLVAPSWDLGIFTQLARAYGELRAPIVPIKGDDANLLGDHFHPILVLLAPLWWVWPSGLALLWAQAALLGLSAVPITRLAIHRLGAGPGLVLGAGYALGFGLQAAAAAQFHEVAFAVPLLALSLCALVSGRIGPAIGWALPLVLVKEDLGLTVAMLGAVIAWRHRDRAADGIALLCWGLGWFVLATWVILPLLNTAGQYDYSDNLASPMGVLWPPVKWGTLALLLLSAGLLGARSPLIALMAPTLAWRFLGSVEHYWGWSWHYSAILMPIAALALLDVLGDRRTGAAGSWLRADGPRPGPRLQTAAVATTLAPLLILGSSLPLLDVLHPDRWERTWRAGPAAAVLEAAPDGMVLATDITLMAQAVPDHDVQWIHGPNQRVPDCVLGDEYAFSWGGEPPEDLAAWAQEEWGEPYGTVREDGGFTLVCR